MQARPTRIEGPRDQLSYAPTCGNIPVRRLHPDYAELQWASILHHFEKNLSCQVVQKFRMTTMPKTKSASKEATKGTSPSRLIDARIKELGDWRGETLARIRAIIKQADPEVVEEWKWRGVPIWSHSGIICTGETYKIHVKMTFPKGASLEDPSGLFNAGLEGGTRRAIDFHEGDKIDGKALKALIRAAVALNVASAKRRGRSA